MSKLVKSPSESPLALSDESSGASMSALAVKPPTLSTITLRRVVANVIAILASDVTQRLAAFVMYALVARYLGAHAFGQLSLGLTYFQTFQFLAIAGIQALITREVARDRAQTGALLVNGSLAVALFSLLAMLLLGLFTQVMHYAADTSLLILLLAAGLTPYALSVICDAIFQGWEQMHHITMANFVVNLLKTVLLFALLWLGYDLIAIALLFFVSYLLLFWVKWQLLRRHIVNQIPPIDLRFCQQMIRDAVTFLGIDGLMAIMSTFQVILLSKLASEVEVGLFNAATQLLTPVSLIFQSVAISIFPLMVRSYQQGARQLQMVVERLLELLLALVIPTAVGLIFFADEVLLLLYGDATFTRASIVLNILVWAMVLRVFTQVLGRVLVATLREKATLQILAIDTLASLILGSILISQYGLLGAALTSLLVRLIDFILHYLPVSAGFGRRLPMEKLLWKASGATLAMAGLWLLMAGRLDPFLQMAWGALAYTLGLGLLVWWEAGSFAQLKSRYLYFIE